MPLYLGRLYRAILKESRTLQEADEKFDAAVSDLLITEAKKQSTEKRPARKHQGVHCQGTWRCSTERCVCKCWDCANADPNQVMVPDSEME